MPHSTTSNPSPPTPLQTSSESVEPSTTNTTTTTTTTTPPPTLPDIATPTSLRTLNRRRTYLAQHPDYFANPDLEYINPLLYDRCVRAFQSAEDREAAGKERGWSAVLEAGLRRGEARLERLRDRDREREERGGLIEVDEDEEDEEEGGRVRDKEEGEKLWRDVVGDRFLKGLDVDFDYSAVDDDEALDVEEQRDREEAWYDGEEESAVRAEYQTGIQDF